MVHLSAQLSCWVLRLFIMYLQTVPFSWVFRTEAGLLSNQVETGHKYSISQQCTT